VGSQLARRVAGSQSAVDRLTSAQLSAEVWQHRYNRLATQVQPPDNRYKCLATDTNVWQQTQTSGNRHKRLATQTQTSGNRHKRLATQIQTSGNRHKRLATDIQTSGNRHKRLATHIQTSGNTDTSVQARRYQEIARSSQHLSNVAST